MKKTLIVTSSFLMMLSAGAQVVRDHRKTPKPSTNSPTKPTTNPVIVDGTMVLLSPDIVVYEHANYSGQSKTLTVGTYRLTGVPGDLNDQISSIKVPAGMAVMIYEHSNNTGGYGSYVDLLENTPDLAVYNFNDKISYINVFTVERAGGHVWVRGRNANNTVVPGHWERKRANGTMPDNSPPGVVLEVYETGDAAAAATATQAEIDEFDKIMSEQSGVAVLGGETTAPIYYHHNKPNEEVYKYNKVIDPSRLPGAFFDWAANKLGWAGIVVKPFEVVSDVAGDIKDFIFGSSSTKVKMDCWYPVSEFRQTVCGKLKEDALICSQDFLHTQVTIDKDVCYNLIPSPGFTSMLTNRWTGETSTVIEGEVKTKNLTNFNTQTQKSTETTTPRNPMLLQIKKDENVCLYGPWMGDILDLNLNVPVPLTNQRVEIADLNLRKNNEIHPVNQLWRKVGNETHLIAVVDGTGYFQVRGNGEVEASGLNQSMRFYIAFTIPGKSRPGISSGFREYDINGIAFDITDGTLSEIPAETVTLKHRGNVAVKIKANSILRLQKTFNVSFDKVRKRPNGSIQGYIVVETVRITKQGGSINIIVKDQTVDNSPVMDAVPVRERQ